MQDLSISMYGEMPKKHLRSNFKMYVHTICIILFAISLFRFWITRDTVSNFHSEETQISIQIFKNIKNIEQLGQNLGQVAVLGPLTVNNIINFSNREFALHLNELGQISEISTDIELSEQQQVQLDWIGLDSIVSNGKTLISVNSINNVQVTNTQFTLHALNPFFDGKIRTSEQDGWLAINTKGLALHGFGKKADINTKLNAASDTNIISQISSVQTKYKISNQLSSFSNNPFNLITKNLSSSWKLVTSIDKDGKYYYSLLIEKVFELNELAELAKYINSVTNLSTIALTLSDETTISEIKSTNEPLVSITTEQDTHFIHLVNEASELHLTQTPTNLLITNFSNSLILDDIQNKSTCKLNAHTFIDLDHITNEYKSASILNHLNSIAVNKNTIFICW